MAQGRFRASRSLTRSSLIAAGTTVVGDLAFSGRLRIEGVVTGRVDAVPIEGSEVLIGPQGAVEGGLAAEYVQVAGRLAGEVLVERRLEVLAGARVDARIRYRDIQIHRDARLLGSLCAIEGEGVALRLQATRRGG